MTPEQVRQVDLVGTAQDGCRVINDHEPFLFRLLGKAVGMVVNGGGLADEQGVILGKAEIVPVGDEIHIRPQLVGRLDELAQGRLVAGRQLFLRVHENGQIVFVGLACSGGSPDLAAVLIQRIGKGGLFRVAADRSDGEGFEAGDLPVAALADGDAQSRAGETLEQLPGQAVEAGQVTGAEPGVDDQAAVFVHLRRSGRLFDLVFQFFRLQDEQRALFNVVEHAYTGNDVMAACLGKQGAVITVAQILVTAAEVDDAHTLEPFRILQIEVFLEGDHIFTGIERGPVVLVVNDQVKSGHG